MPNPLIVRARNEGTPLIDGHTVTFVWQGPGPVKVMADFNGWESGSPDEMVKIAPRIWKLSVEFPLDAYMEYVFLVNGERAADPFNRRKTQNGLGKTNHYFYMPLAKPAPFFRRRKGIPHGKVTAIDVETGWFLPGGKRKVTFYQPAVESPCPLVLVWDGQDYLRRAHLPVMIDNLVAQKRIRPVALAMVQSIPATRAVEYLCSEASLAFVQLYLLPAARQQLNLLDPSESPGAFGVLGASAGGLMAFYTGLRMPHIFGKILAQGGAYTFFGQEMVVWDLARCLEPQDQKFWLCAGRYDFLRDGNRKMAALLKERGFEYQYDEYAAGHNYPGWRDHLWQGLEFTFGK
jgi:enterochelin esterase-like enzyme